MRTWKERINAILASVERFIKTFFGCYYQNGITRVELMGDTNMGLKYRAFFPPVGTPDVVYRELRVVVDGAESILRVSADKTSADLPVVGEGVRVGLAVRDTDDAGNTSEWSERCLLTISECHPSRQVHFTKANILSQQL